MKAIVLTPNEKEVLVAIVNNARSVGDNGFEFILSDVAEKLNRSIRSITGTAANLQKKGLIACANGDSYFDGDVTEDGFQVFKEITESQENEEGENPMMDERIVYMNGILATKLASLSKSKREAIKADKLIAKHILENWNNAEVKGGLKTLIDDKEVETMQYKLWCIAKSRYEQLVAAAAKEIDEFPEELEKLVKEEVEAEKKEDKIEVSPTVSHYFELKKKHPDAILLFRCKDFYEIYGNDAAEASKILGITLTSSKSQKDVNGEALKIAGFPCYAFNTYLPKLVRAGKRVAISEKKDNPKLIKKNTDVSEKDKDDVVATSETATTASENPKVKESTPKKSNADSKKKYNVGDHHPNHPDWIYTEYKPGKFDWRADKSVAKVKSKNKPTTEAQDKKSSANTKKVDEPKTQETKKVSVEEFLNLLRNKNKGLSNIQQAHVKLIKKGYRITGDKKFFVKDGAETKACNWDSVVALTNRVGVNEVEGLVK